MDYQSFQHPRPARRRGRLLRWAAYLLVMIGGAALGWCAAILVDTYLTQRQARERLESMPSTPPPARRLPPATKRPPSGPPVIVKPGTPLAELSIPRLGVSAIVLQGSDDRTLRVGLGHIESTALPGESGNVAIAGHRDSFFRPLRNVQIGDDIMLDTPAARVHYRVSSYRVVHPSEVSVIRPTDDAVLTLVTCFPFYFIGSAPDRFIVRANFVGDYAAVPVKLTRPPDPPARKLLPAGQTRCGPDVRPREPCRQRPVLPGDPSQRPAPPRSAQSAH
jgi:sortase A